MEKLVIILSLATVCIVILSVTVSIDKSKPGIVTYHKPKPAYFKPLNYMHAFLSVIMMLALITTDTDRQFLSFPDKISIEKTIAFLSCFGVISFFPWKSFNPPDHKVEYEILHPFVVFIYASLRLVFLISYECFFRGSLLFSVSVFAGATWSIVINIFLYTLMHIHKDKKEILGCIPFGLLLCLFTVWWQSLWPAVIFHSQIAIIHEWPPLRKFISPQNQAAL